jgi:2-polyprenyl-6-methoxyphenol hydroxylase-like FAD-dependent oxidoreductase
VSTARVAGPVKIVGSGLIGTSIGLALTQAGVEVLISDSSPAVQDLAVDFGAGEVFKDGQTPAHQMSRHQLLRSSLSFTPMPPSPMLQA